MIFVTFHQNTIRLTLKKKSRESKKRTSKKIPLAFKRTLCDLKKEASEKSFFFIVTETNGLAYHRTPLLGMSLTL